MQKIITIVLLSLAMFITQDQNLSSEQLKTSEIKTFEQQFGSKMVSSSSSVSYSISSEICPAVEEYEFAQPIRYARPGENLPPFVVEYFYSKSDSVVRCVLYTVVTPDDPRFEKLGMPIYEKIFRQMVSQLNKELGKPNQLDNEFKETGKKEVTWQNKNMTVEGYLSKANKRIRLMQNWN